MSALARLEIALTLLAMLMVAAVIAAYFIARKRSLQSVEDDPYQIPQGDVPQVSPRLAAAVARRNAERGRPLTPGEKLENLRRFLAEEEEGDVPHLPRGRR